MPPRAGQQRLLLAARLDIDERRAQPVLVRVVIDVLDLRLLQHMLADAARLQRVRARILQPFDAQLQQQPVLVGDRRLSLRILLARAVSGTQ